METPDLDRVNLWMQRNYHAFKVFEEGPPEQRFGWLINLLQRPMEEVLENWVEALAPEAAAFAARNTDMTMVKEAASLPPAKIESLFLPIMRGLEHLMRGRQWTLHLPPTARIFTKIADLPFEVIPEARSFEGAFLDEVCAAVTAMGDRLSICARPGCGKAFVRRKRGTHCGNACAQRERTDRYLKKLAEAKQLQEKRHKRYVAAVERKDGPSNAKKVRRRAKVNA